MEERFWRGRVPVSGKKRQRRTRQKCCPGSACEPVRASKKLRIFAAASGNSTRNATILFAGTDPFNLDETASSYFVSGDPCSGDRLFGERFYGDAGLGPGAGRGNSVRRAIFCCPESASERADRSPGEHPRPGHPD